MIFDTNMLLFGRLWIFLPFALIKRLGLVCSEGWIHQNGGGAHPPEQQSVHFEPVAIKETEQGKQCIFYLSNAIRRILLNKGFLNSQDMGCPDQQRQLDVGKVANEK